ncbi:MAG TPA: hypothetical protein VIE39_06340 [Thermoanaerobaculia bacterium]|jgi:hypothetical protein
MRIEEILEEQEKAQERASKPPVVIWPVTPGGEPFELPADEQAA